MQKAIEHQLYNTWQQMKQRCYNSKAKDYVNYGQRGIKVCDRWLTFWNFAEDMGERPEGTTLDRIDNDGPYAPENCRWATAAEQTIHRRHYGKVGLRGVTYHQGKYMARIVIQGVTYHLGYHNTKEEAHDSYLHVFREWYGELP